MRSLRQRPPRCGLRRSCVVETLEERKLFSTDGFNDQVIWVSPGNSGGDVQTYPGVTAGGDAAQPNIGQWHTGSGDLDIVASGLPAHTRLAFEADVATNDYGNGMLTVTIDNGVTLQAQADYWGDMPVQQGYGTDNWPVGTDMVQHTGDTIDMHIHVDCAPDKIWHLTSAEMETTTFVSVQPVQDGTADPNSAPLEWTISRDAANGHDQNVYFDLSGRNTTIVSQVDPDTGLYLGDLYPLGSSFNAVGNNLGGAYSSSFMATIPAGSTSVTVMAQPTGILWTDPNGDEGGLVPRPVTLQLFTPDQYIRDNTNAFTAYWHDAVPGVDDDNATVNLQPFNTINGGGRWYRAIAGKDFPTTKVLLSLTPAAPGHANVPNPIDPQSEAGGGDMGRIDDERGRRHCRAGLRRVQCKGRGKHDSHWARFRRRDPEPEQRSDEGIHRVLGFQRHPVTGRRRPRNDKLARAARCGGNYAEVELRYRTGSRLGGRCL
jgi:hypothetical protein